MASNIDEARQLAKTLLNDLESGSSSSDGILMMAKRLARLMRDGDAQLWLEYEISGYPNPFNSDTLGTCKKYAFAAGRITAENKYYVVSLPALEADATAREQQVQSFKKADSTAVIENFVVKRATEEFINNQLTIQNNYRQAFTNAKALAVSIKSSIHTYVTDTFLAIEFGDVAQEIFEAARNDVDNFVRSYCPKAAEQIVAINERMRDQTIESRTAALTTCRRLLLTIADALFPSRSEEWTDSKGRKRKVGPDDYKNRLLAYLDERQQSDGSAEVTSSGIEHLAARLDAIYSKTSKGVHVDVTEQEARLTVIHTYLFVGEIAAHSRSKPE